MRLPWVLRTQQSPVEPILICLKAPRLSLIPRIQQEPQLVRFRLRLQVFVDKNPVEQSSHTRRDVHRKIHPGAMLVNLPPRLVQPVENVTLHDAALPIPFHQIPRLQHTPHLKPRPTLEHSSIPSLDIRIPRCHPHHLIPESLIHRLGRQPRHRLHHHQHRPARLRKLLGPNRPHQPLGRNLLGKPPNLLRPRRPPQPHDGEQDKHTPRFHIAGQRPTPSMHHAGQSHVQAVSSRSR
jgi:hypothetical protein